jgi:4-amino-4-deoxy-L-arabinose transferase-like glycosyltransferase
VVVAVLSLHLAPGVCRRALWKPDEPREAAIAGRMARPGSDMAVPHLGERPFCEKPPLYYWVATGSIRLLGSTPVAARLPT